MNYYFTLIAALLAMSPALATPIASAPPAESTSTLITPSRFGVDSPDAFFNYPTANDKVSST
ncbi:hypothetical protein D9619_000125 [Psilocybe cf. subviscida]|uniref:Uncharacterized protein n=1 Tax=Psilocybe cf. subviscida TaxID=2480587 RepID=A0A8H5BFA9_9AGAR|nr:hypothetical protein D9619_000125 [Psilocybe cf. subviscida]